MMLRKDWHHHSHLCNNESVNEESGLSIGPGRRHNLKSQGSARCNHFNHPKTVQMAVSCRRQCKGRISGGGNGGHHLF
eukprot:scaffold56370_cov19-Tisochrysis_lutea.AAC.3